MYFAPGYYPTGYFSPGYFSSGSIVAPPTPMITYTDVLALIRGLPPLDSCALPDATLLPIVVSYDHWLTLQYPCIGTYGTLTGIDKQFYDMALSRMVAAHSRSWLPKSSAVGELTMFNNGNPQFQYTGQQALKSEDVFGRLTQTIEHQWLEEAWLNLQQVACIRKIVTDFRASFRTFAVAGAARRAQRMGFIDFRRSPLYAVRVQDIITFIDWGKG